MGPDVLLIRATDLARACPMADAIDAVAPGFVALSEGRAHVPVRIGGPIAEGGGTHAMPATLDGSPYFSVKIVAVAPAAPAAGFPLVNATVLLGDAVTGAPLAILEGASLTALRTGAAGGVAARALAALDASVLALFGAGAQARTQLAAALAVRPIAEVRIVARERRHAETFAAWARGAHPEVRFDVSTADAAIDGAGIVITATSSAVPVFSGQRLADGAHVTAVGAFRPETRELDDATMRGARIVVDQRAGALHEAGEIQGLGPGDVVELGEVLAGTVPGRTAPGERTVFKSVGNGIQDLVVASLVYERCRSLGIGEEIRWP